MSLSLAVLNARMRRFPADALFSGRTAAWLHGLDKTASGPIEVTLPVTSTTSHLARVRLTRSDFGPDEACEIRGLPATSAARTVADIARTGYTVDAVVTIEHALRSAFVEVGALEQWAECHPRHRGVAGLFRALALAEVRSESPMETRLRVLLIDAGLPRPCVQATVRDEHVGFVARPDLSYPDSKLAIEYDGATHRERIAADDRRQNRLTDAGYRVLRFTAADVLHRPASVVAEVRRALG